MKSTIIYFDEDDNQVNRLRKKLSPKYAIEHCANYDQLVGSVNQFNPSLVLLDPVFSGIKQVNLIRILKQSPSTRLVPIIVISDPVKGLNLRDSLAAGADDFVGKPIKMEELENRIDGLLLNHELDQAYMLKRRRVAMRSLINGFNHQFNNYLMILQGGLENLKPYSENTISQKLQMMLSTSKRAKNLLQEINKLYKKGFLPNSQKTVSQLLDESIEQIKINLDFGSIPLIIKRSGNIDIGVRVDDISFQSVLSEILNNSLESFQNVKDHRNPAINLSVRKVKDFIEVIVHDNGCGILPQHIDMLFDPFYSTKGSIGGNASKFKEDYTGLGLTLAETIAICSGGSIVVRSKFGHGTTLTWRIPVSVDDQKLLNLEPLFRIRKFGCESLKFVIFDPTDSRSRDLIDYLEFNHFHTTKFDCISKFEDSAESISFDVALIHTDFGPDKVDVMVNKLRDLKGRFFPIFVTGDHLEFTDLKSYCQHNNLQFFKCPVDYQRLIDCLSDIPVLAEVE